MKSIFRGFLIFSVLVCSVAKTEAQNITLSEAELSAFKENALQKTTQLSRYLDVLCDKSQPDSKKEEAVHNAIDLFASEEKVVQVSSKNHDRIKTYKIRPYLNTLRALNYARVEITWYNIEYVSEFKKGQDGKYYATISLFQEFKGFDAEGNLRYADRTQKNIEVSIDNKEFYVGDRVYESKAVQLGDISVIQTRDLKEGE